MDRHALNVERQRLLTISELWQLSLLNPRSLQRFANERSVSIFNHETVVDLWKLGLVRADRITSTTPLAIPSVELVSESKGLYLWCDQRLLQPRPSGYGTAFAALDQELPEIGLFFHPFRLYVLYHIARVFQMEMASTQYLLWKDGYGRLAEIHVKHLDSWTASEGFLERFDHWNATAELAALLEPIAYPTVAGALNRPANEDQDQFHAKLKSHEDCTLAFLKKEIALAEVRQRRQELATDAESVDRNKLLHVLLRLMSHHERSKLRDAIGCCMQFLCMSEVIRRVVEKSHGTELPEEDELGFGQWLDGARSTLYGTERIVDASPKARRDFLTSMELDAGVKTRCYVEGDTEYGALSSAVGDAGGTEFVNLSGQVVEKGGRGLQFAASLASDKTHGVLSVVMLDDDVGDNVRVLKRAAERGTFFGRFFLNSPDLEFANFSLAELVEVLLRMASRGQKPLPDRVIIAELVKGTRSNKEFFRALRGSPLEQFGKSVAWGEELMRFALEKPHFGSDHVKAGTQRPLVDAAKLLVIARHAGYQRSVASLKVDVNTGQLVPR
jgi:hypothetical protein